MEASYAAHGVTTSREVRYRSRTCSSKWSRAARRTCTSRSARSRPCASWASSSASRSSTGSRPHETQRLLYRILSTEQQKHLEIKRQIDISYSIPGLARFRVNVYFQRESLGAAFRMIPAELKTLERARDARRRSQSSASKPRGLVLVTGPTGSGKSTTLAALIDEINRRAADHIMTIEDPIEFLHRHKRCIVNQREIGPDATSFAEALRGALRQDPDVILLGEMRDLETIATALTAAETGHLVFATLHTQDAPSTVDRLIDVFPAAQQEQVRVQIAATLQGVVTQTLLPRLDGGGRVAARRDPPPGRRRPEPDPPGEGRADLLGHADRHAARDADARAEPRGPRPEGHRLARGRARRAPAARTSSRAPGARRGVRHLHPACRAAELDDGAARSSA